MREFFAVLRKEIFRVASNVVIGVIARDAIRDVYLPEIQKKIDKAKKESEKAKLQDLYDEYAEYADRSKKGHEFDRAAAAAIRQTLKAFGGSEQDMDDVAQETVANLYGVGARRSQAWKKAVSKFDPLKNHPKQFLSYFTTVVSTRARSVWRDMSGGVKSERNKMRTVPIVDDEGGNIDIPTTKVELNEFDESWMRDTLRDMTRYVMRKLGKPWVKEMFKRWMKFVIDGEAESVNFTKDIIKPMMESDEDSYPGTPSMYRRTWKGVVEHMVDYFEKVLTPPLILTDRAKKKILKISADKVAAEEYRIRFSRWMLGR